MSKLNGEFTTIGWDIGGAHLKAVQLDAGGRVLHALQLPCQLWRGLHTLESAMQTVLQTFKTKPEYAHHAITMTGELVDLFENRHHGVLQIAQFAEKLLGQNCQFYAATISTNTHGLNTSSLNTRGFVNIDQVAPNTGYIASANWHASASALAQHVNDALFVDIGSTTTDIIAIEAGHVSSAALSDAGRLQQDTLIYTGVIRTPVMALAQKISFAGLQTNVMAEYFATMADVYRLTNELSPAVDMAETADDQGKSQQQSARRLARMVGFDVEDKPMSVWVELAYVCKEIQLKQLKVAILKHLKPNTPIIGAGAGSFLVAQLAAELNCTYRTIDSALATDPALMSNTTLFNGQSSDLLAANLLQHNNLAVCFPAYAVAYLSFNHQTEANQA